MSEGSAPEERAIANLAQADQAREPSGADATGTDADTAPEGEGDPANIPSQVDSIADAALRDLMQRMREASAGEIASDIPEDED